MTAKDGFDCYVSDGQMQAFAKMTGLEGLQSADGARPLTLMV